MGDGRGHVLCDAIRLRKETHVDKIRTLCSYKTMFTKRCAVRRPAASYKFENSLNLSDFKEDFLYFSGIVTNYVITSHRSIPPA